VVGRQIIVAEQMALHLVTYRGSIFIKPIPGCLLDDHFFKVQLQPDPYLHILALAFLSTYLKLIQYNSDFDIAKELGLIPTEMSWQKWLMFTRRLEPESAKLQRRFPHRYRHSELCLDRLNLIAQFLHDRFSRGFITLDMNYTTYFSPIFKGVIFLFAYTGTYLAAFQVVMGAPNAPPELVSMGFWSSVVVLFVLAAITVVVMLWLMFLTLDNFLFAISRRRMAHMS
jgi:hypothetical protein